VPGTINWYDFVVVVALLYGVWSGLRAGLTGEIIRVVGLVLMIVLAAEFYLPVGNWLHEHSPLGQDVSYLIAFVGIAVVVHLIALAARLATHKRMQKLKFAAMVENVGGSLAGVIRMAVIMTWLTILLCLSNSGFWHHTVGEESRFGSFVINQLPAVNNMVKRSFPEKSWLTDLKRAPEPNYEDVGSTNAKASETKHP
jgi:membrane protein required for colicin V production